MKFPKKVISTIAVVITLALVSPTIIPVTNNISTVEAASKVKLNKTKVTTTAGDVINLKITGTSKKVTWESTNSKVAYVTNKGNVYCKKKGTATISAKVAGKTYRCKVTVSKFTSKINKMITYLDKKGYKCKYNNENSMACIVESYRLMAFNPSRVYVCEYYGLMEYDPADMTNDSYAILNYAKTNKRLSVNGIKTGTVFACNNNTLLILYKALPDSKTKDIVKKFNAFQ